MRNFPISRLHFDWAWRKRNIEAILLQAQIPMDVSYLMHKCMSPIRPKTDVAPQTSHRQREERHGAFQQASLFCAAQLVENHSCLGQVSSTQLLGCRRSYIHA